MDSRLTLFAKVLLPLPVPKYYTYRIPSDWNELIQIGQRVIVQFGSRKVYAGIVLDFSDHPPSGYTASYILDILDNEPLVSPKQLGFWKWMAQYYMCYEGDVMAAALPAGYRLQSESKITLLADADIENESLDENEVSLITALENKGELTLQEAAELIEKKSAIKYVKSLYQKGIIGFTEDIKERYIPKKAKYLVADVKWKDETFARTQLNLLEKKAPKQADVMLFLLSQTSLEIAISQIPEGSGFQSAHYKSLEKKGLLKIESRNVDRLQKRTESDVFQLADYQQITLEKINEAFDGKKPAILHGSTGSGKTFIYLELIRKAISEGKQVLYLVPEVGLTEQLVMRIEKYVGEKMGVWHNFYSASEKTELFEKVKKQEISLVIGTRSAVFAPFQNLGLVIVDEEHENSFKQFEKRPHYNGRDAAVKLASMYNAHVLFGSATPSVEMMEAAEKGTMVWVSMLKRYMETPAPSIEIVNVSEENKGNPRKGIFGNHLMEAMSETLKNGEQMIVYQNRKGFVPYISCDLCGHSAQCINCDISLTYFKSSGQQKCNYCGYSQEPMLKCEACGSTEISMKGYGTERLVEELAVIFPDARISRFDQTSIRKRKDFQRILNEFENKEIDILVGTQLLSKGLDFSNVALVAVPDADMLLNIPDFRAHERAFQQLYQVAGRAGRGSKQGRVIIQARQSTHPSVLAVFEDDYVGFTRQELISRKEFSYPPFTRIIEITIRHKVEQNSADAAEYFKTITHKYLGERLIGPQVPSVSRIKNQFLQRFLVKMNPAKDDIAGIKQFLLEASVFLKTQKNHKSVIVDFNVDPA